MPNPQPTAKMSRDNAIEIFTILSGMGFGVAIKHIRGDFQIEVPVRLRGDKAYRKEAEISMVALRAGYIAVQTGSTLRIIGR